MDQGRFRQFYEANFARIYRYVAVRVGKREIAEDLVSEIFLKALKAFESYDESRSRSSWIFTIARNHLANYYRSAGRIVADEEIESMPIAGPDFQKKVERFDEVSKLMKVLSEMPLEKQSLIRMKYLEELSYDEMAERLRRDKNALKVATFRAMKELRESARKLLCWKT